MEKITISPSLFVLRLDDEKIYNGLPHNQNIRWTQFFSKILDEAKNDKNPNNVRLHILVV